MICTQLTRNLQLEKNNNFHKIAMQLHLKPNVKLFTKGNTLPICTGCHCSVNGFLYKFWSSVVELGQPEEWYTYQNLFTFTRYGFALKFFLLPYRYIQKLIFLHWTFQPWIYCKCIKESGMLRIWTLPDSYYFQISECT